MEEIVVYTDGSCIPNPGRGGWAFIAKLGDNFELHGSGVVEKSTNNRMELTAVLEPLEALSEFRNLHIHSDSQTTIKCAKKIWKRKSNIDLWDKYDILSKGKSIRWTYVPAHSGIEYNELVDKMAKKEVKLFEKNKKS